MDTNKINILRIASVEKRVTLKRSSIYQKVKEDRFPQPIIKRPGFTAWSDSDIDLYLIYLQENFNLKWSDFLNNRGTK